MRYLTIYRDSGFTQEFQSVKCLYVHPESFDNPPSTVTYQGKQYRVFDGYGQRLRYCQISDLPPDILSTNNRLPTETVCYMRNGINPIVQESTSRVSIRMYVGSEVYVGSQGVGSGDPVCILGIAFDYQGTLFVGFDVTTVTDIGRVVTIIPTACFEISFWQNAVTLPFDYTRAHPTDKDGNIGTGAIDGKKNPSGISPNPSVTLPTGGQGLHAYRISVQAYSDFQSLLWGQGSTIAKSLWQKFQNMKHTPSSCVIGCYRLPEIFMPTGTASLGISLAGLNLRPITGTCQSVALGFVTLDPIVFNGIDPPFSSFADFDKISCRLHVPFCGELQIPMSEVLGLNKTISLTYRCDISNGNIVCIVRANGWIIGELGGNVAYQVPITSGDNGSLESLGRIAAGAAQIIGGDIPHGAGSLASAAATKYHTQVINGSLTGNQTACENRIPYLEFIKNEAAYPANYLNVYGAVSIGTSGTISAYTGSYCQFEVEIDGDDIPDASEREKQEIVDLLRGGVIV